MGQIRAVDFNELADPGKLIEMMTERAGFHSGYRLEPGDPGKITITAGAGHSNEGMRIEETGHLYNHLTITPSAAGKKRIDRIVMHHQYQQTYPNIAAWYEILVGTEVDSGPQPPSRPADGHTIGYGYIEDGAVDYALIVHTSRDAEDHHLVTLGDGVDYTGEYNGIIGLEKILEEYLDKGVEILFRGEIFGDLALPQGLHIRGCSGKAVIDGEISSAGFARSTGLTIAGTKKLTDASADFSKTAIGTLVMIANGGADDGAYRVTARDGATGLFLDAPSNFAGSGPGDYQVIVADVALERLDVSGDINFDYTYAWKVHQTGFDAMKGGNQTIAPDLAQCYLSGEPSIELSDISGGSLVDVQCAGDVDIDAETGPHVDGLRSLGAIHVPDGCGNTSWPFNEQHNADGSHKVSEFAGDGLQEGGSGKMAVKVEDFAGWGLEADSEDPKNLKLKLSDIKMECIEFGVLSEILRVLFDDVTIGKELAPDEVSYQLYVKQRGITAQEFSVSGCVGGSGDAGDSISFSTPGQRQNIRVKIPAGKILKLRKARFYLADSNLRLRLIWGSQLKWTSIDNSGDVDLTTTISDNSAYSEDFTSLLSIQIYNSHESAAKTAAKSDGWELEFTFEDS